MAEFAGVGEVLHDGHQTKHCTDDAQSRRIDAHALKYFGSPSIDGLPSADIDL